MIKISRFMRSVFSALILGACALGLSSQANADAYDWFFNSTDTTSLNASGTFFTTGTLITSITGTSNGSAITILLPPGTCCSSPSNDNVFDPSGAPWLDLGGLAYQTFAGDQVNIFSASAANPPNALAIINNGPNIGGTMLIEAVPEPETYALLLAGLGLMGFVSRRRKQRAA